MNFDEIARKGNLRSVMLTGSVVPVLNTGGKPRCTFKISRYSVASVTADSYNAVFSLFFFFFFFFFFDRFDQTLPNR